MPNIGFLIRSPHDYFVYKNTYHNIINRGIDGVNLIVKRIHSIPIVEPYADKFYEYICNMMDSRKELYIHDPNPEWTIEGDHKIIIYNNNGVFCSTKKIRMLYSHAKENWTFGSLACGEYDLILTYGQRSTELCGRYKPTCIVGHPKYDDWFNGSVNVEETESYRKLLDPNKKTVLYVPTWGEIGSTETYYNSINSLTEKYNVILKCHDSLYWREPDNLARFDSKNIIILNGSSDIQCLFKLADVVIGDNSGAMMESIYLDKPTIFLEVSAVAGSGLTSGGSTEQTCRSNFLMVDKPTDIDMLNSAIERSINNAGEFKQKRLEVTTNMYEYRDGRCSNRAANAIIKFLEEKC